MIYRQKIRVIDDLGMRLLVPASELSRILESARPYDPQSADNVKHEVTAMR
jgi:hypothetical protein